MSRSRSSYRPRGQRQWSRVDAEWSAQGHALETETSSGTYYAWQDETDGPFYLMRVDEHGREFGPVEIPDFVVARIAVAQAESTAEGRPLNDARLTALAVSQYRRTNPSDERRSFNADLKADEDDLIVLAQHLFGSVDGAFWPRDLIDLNSDRSTGTIADLTFLAAYLFDDGSAPYITEHRKR